MGMGAAEMEAIVTGFQWTFKMTIPLYIRSFRLHLCSIF